MNALKEEIKNQNFKQIYLFYGEETYLLRKTADRLKKAIIDPADTMNFSAFEGKDLDVQKVIDTAQTFPFFAEKRCIFVERSGLFLTGKEVPDTAPLEECLKQLPETTYIIFAEPQVDKRSRLFKEVKKQGRLVECPRQTQKDLTTFVLQRCKAENKQIRQNALALFFEKTGDDLELINVELEKLFSYTLGKEGIESADVEEICLHKVSDKVFDMIDAMANHQQKEALERYYDLLLLREAPLKILSLLQRQFHILLQVKELDAQGFGSKHIASVVKIPEFAAKKNLAQARRFTKPQLQKALADALQAEEDFKNGRIDDQLVVELFLISYSR